MGMRQHTHGEYYHVVILVCSTTYRYAPSILVRRHFPQSPPVSRARKVQPRAVRARRPGRVRELELIPTGAQPAVVAHAELERVDPVCAASAIGEDRGAITSSNISDNVPH